MHTMDTVRAGCRASANLRTWDCFWSHWWKVRLRGWRCLQFRHLLANWRRHWSGSVYRELRDVQLLLWGCHNRSGSVPAGTRLRQRHQPLHAPWRSDLFPWNESHPRSCTSRTHCRSMKAVKAARKKIAKSRKSNFLRKYFIIQFESLPSEGEIKK